MLAVKVEMQHGTRHVALFGTLYVEDLRVLRPAVDVPDSVEHELHLVPARIWDIDEHARIALLAAAQRWRRAARAWRWALPSGYPSERIERLKACGEAEWIIDPDDIDSALASSWPVD